MPKPYDRLEVQGHTLDWITYAAFLDAQARPNGDNDWSILQGCYNAGGVSQSAGTHDGGGALDVSPFNWQQRVHALRAVGFAAWHRTEIPGTWGEHIHCILIGNNKLAPAARQQVTDYYNHIDGLAGHTTPDNTWHPNPIPVFDYAQWMKENAVLPGDLAKIQDVVAADGDKTRAVINARAKGTRETVLKALDALPDGATKKDVRAAVDKAFASQTPEVP